MIKVENKFPIKVQDVHCRHVAGSMEIKARMNHVRHVHEHALVMAKFGCLSGGSKGSRAPTTEDVDN